MPVGSNPRSSGSLCRLDRKSNLFLSAPFDTLAGIYKLLRCLRDLPKSVHGGLVLNFRLIGSNQVNSGAFPVVMQVRGKL